MTDLYSVAARDRWPRSGDIILIPEEEETTELTDNLRETAGRLNARPGLTSELRALLQLAPLIIDVLEEILAGVDNLNQQVQRIATLAQRANAQIVLDQQTITALHGQLDQANQQVASLQQQVQSGAGVTSDQIDSLAQTLADAAGSLQSTLDTGATGGAAPAGGAGTPDPSGTAVPTTDPAAGGGAPTPGAPTTDPTATDPTATDPTGTPGAGATTTGTSGGVSPDPSAGTVDPSAGGAAPPPAVDTGRRTQYVVDPGAAVDTVNWPPTGQQTVNDPQGPRPTYYFAQDTEPGQRSGDGAGGVWHAWDGETEAIPAAGAGPGGATA